MNGQQLKNSILQMAVEGKLVPQNENDEPASVLIDRIAKEKEQLVKDKKIKKDKNVSRIFQYEEDSLWYEEIGKEVKCIQEELPFELPTGWSWVRIGNISNFGQCTNSNPDDIPDDAWLLDLEDIEKDSSRIINKKIKSNTKCNSTKHYFVKKQVLYSKLRPYLNKVVVATESGYCTSEIIPISFYGNILSEYAKTFLMSPYFVNYAVENSQGVKMPRFKIATGIIFLMPLPPLAEQQRIVSKIEELLPLVDDYGVAHSKLEKLNSDFPSDLKKSLLQWAVQGKLVPQNENDEPASILIDRIAKEKEQLVKDKKIKKDKNVSRIFQGEDDGLWYEEIGKGEIKCIEEELPFAVPMGWSWCRLKALSNTITCGYASTPKYVDNGKPFISAKNIKPYNFKYKQHNFISDELYNKLVSTNKPEKGDILMTRVGAGIGEACIIDIDMDFAIYVSVTLIKLSKINLNAKYFLFWIDSPMGVHSSRANIFGKTSSQGNLNVEKVRNFLIPIPPLAEQHRIVEKLESVLSEIERL